MTTWKLVLISATKKCMLYLKQLTLNLIHGIIRIIVPTNYILLNVLTK